MTTVNFEGMTVEVGQPPKSNALYMWSEDSYQVRPRPWIECTRLLEAYGDGYLLLQIFSVTLCFNRCPEGFQLAGIIKCSGKQINSVSGMDPVNGIELVAYTFEENTWDSHGGEEFRPVKPERKSYSLPFFLQALVS
jgi:hypothetical protein